MVFLYLLINWDKRLLFGGGSNRLPASKSKEKEGANAAICALWGPLELSFSLLCVRLGAVNERINPSIIAEFLVFFNYLSRVIMQSDLRNLNIIQLFIRIVNNEREIISNCGAIRVGKR